MLRAVLEVGVNVSGVLTAGAPGDDYLVALARSAGADVLVSGDPHITGVAGLEPPVLTPRQLLEFLHNA